MTKSVLKRSLAAVGTAVAAVGIVLAQPASAQAIPLDMDLNVTTTVTALGGQEVQIPPGTMTGEADLGAGTINANLNLPPTQFTANIFGFLPVNIEYHVDEVEPGVVGTLDLEGGTMDVESNFDVRLSSVSLFGVAELLDPAQTCKTTTPSVADLTGTLSLEGGITAELSGTYDIAAMEGCGDFWGGIIGLFTSGVDNGLTITATQPL